MELVLFLFFDCYYSFLFLVLLCVSQFSIKTSFTACETRRIQDSEKLLC